MSAPVAITGVGLVSALGMNVDAAMRSLLDGRSGVRPIRQLQTRYRGELVAGEVDLSDDELRARAGVQGEAFGRAAVLALLAAREAVADAGLSAAELLDAGLVGSTTVGGVGRTERYYHRLAEEPEHLGCLQTHDCGESTRRVADGLGVRGFVTTVSTACSSSANALLLGARLIRAGKLSRVVVGGADALARFTLNGFKALMILDAQPSRPFDDDRKGLNLGEAGAFLVLEALPAAQARGARVRGLLRGYGNAADAFHQTASSPTGVGSQKAMAKALATAGLVPADIDCVNAHGTGTPNNDLSEATALKAVFGERVPPFFSTKPFTGHTLGAAGATEAVLSVLTLERQRLFPNLHWQTPMKELPLAPVTEPRAARVRHVLSNSFGFGGNCTSLVLSAVDA